MFIPHIFRGTSSRLGIITKYGENNTDSDDGRRMMRIKHIFVVGVGTMGNGIAQVAATSGYQVTCMDVRPAALDKAKATIAKSTTKLFEKGVLTQEQKDLVDKIQYVEDMDTMRSADF